MVRFLPSMVFLLFLSGGGAGCAHRYHSVSDPVTIAQVLVDQGVRKRIAKPAEPDHVEAETVVAGGARKLDKNWPAAAPHRSAMLDLEATPELSAGSTKIEVLTLPAAIEFALANNPRLQLYRAAILRAQGQEQVEFAPFLPEIGILTRGIATSANLGAGAPGPTGAVEGNPLKSHQFGQAELQLQWSLYDFGRTAGKYRQAVARERLTEYQLERANQTVAFDVTAAYFGLLQARANRLVQEEAIRSAESVLKDTKARRDNGVADPDDVLRAEVELARTRENLVLAQEAEANAVSRLNFTMGRNASQMLQIVDWTKPPAYEQTLVASLEIAAAERPEVAIARQAIEAAAQGREAAAADFRPRVYMLGTVGYVDGESIATGWQEGAGIHLNQLLYAGGQRRGRLQIADAEIQAAAAQAQVVFDSISLEVNIAYRSVLATRRRIELARPAVDQAKENLRLVRVKYRNGDATPTDVVDAETALTQAQERFYTATYEYLTSLARMDYTLGRPQGTLLGPAPLAKEERKNDPLIKAQ